MHAHSFYRYYELKNSEMIKLVLLFHLKCNKRNASRLHAVKMKFLWSTKVAYRKDKIQNWDMGKIWKQKH